MMSDDENDDGPHLDIDVEELGWKQFSCDVCGGKGAFYDPNGPEPTQCFTCLCNRLDKLEVECATCGWKGKYFDQAVAFDDPRAKASGKMDYRCCPNCGADGVQDETEH